MIVLKILLIILLIMIGFVVIVCLSSISAHISYWEGAFTWSIRYFGIKIFPLPFPIKRKEKSGDKPDKKKRSSKKSDDQSTEKLRKPMMDGLWEKLQKFAETMDMAENGMYALSPALSSLGNALTWYAIETDILIANEDAADCARQYGLMQIILQNLFSQTGHLMHVKRKNIRLRYDFIQDKSEYNIRCRVKVHIGKAIGAVLVFLWQYFRGSQKAKQAVIRERV